MIPGFIGNMMGGQAERFALYNGTIVADGVIDIGPPAPDRMVVIICHFGRNPANSAAVDVTSVTLGGQTMTPIVKALQSTGTGARSSIHMHATPFPSGTSAAVFASITATAFSKVYSSFSLYNLDSPSPFGTGTAQNASGTSITNTLNMPTGGIQVAGGRFGGGGLPSGWNNMTRVDTSGSATNMYLDQNLAAQTGRVLTQNAPSSGAQVLISASWS